MRRFSRLIGLALAVFAALWVWAQELVVCPSCGREGKSVATVCAHCGTALPRPQAAVARTRTVEGVADPAAEVGRMALDVVKACVGEGRGLEDRQPGTALCDYQNALALMRLVPEADKPEGAGDAILSGNDRMMQALLRGKRLCRRCKGSGKYQFDMGKYDRSKGVRSASDVACPSCKGQGWFPGVREIDQVKTSILQGRRDFEQRQMVAGNVKVGRAFVPAALERLLTNRQRALVMTGMPVPCSKCQLTARQACSACKGTGWVTCRYPECSKGVLDEERGGGSSIKTKRMNDELLKTCPACKGIGEVSCERCQGLGCVPCGQCDGSGTGPRCSRCTGTGLSVCVRCKGTGELKGQPCPECKGEKMILCPSCRGEGALSR